MALTDRQEMFCREYLIDLNAMLEAIISERFSIMKISGLV